jgi:Tfp pilus assembly protein PilO
MLLYKIKKLSWHWHLTAASLCLAITAAGVTYALMKAEKSIRDLETERSELRLRDQKGRSESLANNLNFTHLLPPRTKSDDIIKDIGRFASATGVQIQSIQVRPKNATEIEHGSMDFAITLTGDYRATKAWLSELMARNQALAVNTLNMRQGAQDFSRLETQVSLVLYVRN